MTAIVSNTDVDLEGLTPEGLLSRARALKDELRAQQEQGEAQGSYGDDIHDALLRAGLYHVLHPRKYGGLEFSFEVFMRTIVELAKGDPGAAWSYALGAGRALIVAGVWPEEGQKEMLGGPAKYFRSPQSGTGMHTSTMEAADGGYVLSGSFGYCSGVPHSTHFLAIVLTPGGEDAPPRPVVIALHRDQYEVQEDWGGDQVLGQRASGSNSVRVERAFVPHHMVIPFDWLGDERPQIGVGVELHGNPMYVGRGIGVAAAEQAAVAVGTARAALEEYEALAASKRSAGLFAPKPVPGDPDSTFRRRDPNTHRDFGRAIGMADAAEAILISAARVYAGLCERATSGGDPFSWAEDLRLALLFGEATDRACEAVELLFYTIGSSAIRREQRMQRYFRDTATMRTHPTLWLPSCGTRMGSEYLTSDNPPALDQLELPIA